MELYNEDCLDRLPLIADKSIDCIIADLPYGSSEMKWDQIIPMDKLWKEFNRICKDNAAIVMFGSQPFTSILVNSNIKNFKHEWIWKKDKGANFAHVKRAPMKEHENIVVFGTGRAPTRYFPQKQEREGNGKNLIGTKYVANLGAKSESISGPRMKEREGRVSELRYPSSVQYFNRQTGLHPTQKPLQLLNYLVLTYSESGDTILDPSMGSGTTGVAAAELGRNFIGIELDGEIFNKAKERIEKYAVYGS